VLTPLAVAHGANEKLVAGLYERHFSAARGLASAVARGLRQAGGGWIYLAQ
jgi:hypothetical protein